MSYETKFQQKGERGPAERVSFQRDKIRSDSLADIEKPTNRWSEIPPAIFGGQQDIKFYNKLIYYIL